MSEGDLVEWARGVGFPAAVAWYVLKNVNRELGEVRRLLAVLVDRSPRKRTR